MEKWQEIGIAVLGLVIAAWAVGDWVQVRQLRATGVHTEAHLTSKIRESQIGKGSLFYNYMVSYSFDAGDERITVEHMKIPREIWETLPVIGRIEIVYDPGSPRKSRPLGVVRNQGFPYFWVVFGLFTSVCGAWSVHERKRRAAAAKAN